MVNPIRKTDSDSSATQEMMGVPDYNGSATRISKPGDENPIRTTKEVAYKQYTNGKRMTEDFANDTENNKRTQDFDGTKTMMPGKDDNRSDICTDFSK